MSAKTKVDEITERVMHDLAEVREQLPPETAYGEAWAGIEMFVNLGLRIISKTNPSKVRDAAMALQLQTLIPPSGKRDL